MKSRLTSRRVSRFGWFMAQTWRMGKFLFVFLFICVLAGWMWAGGVFARVGDWAHAQYVSATADMGLVLQDVRVEGRYYLPAADLRRAIGVMPGVPLMGIDLDEVQTRISTLPWVKSVRVRRTLAGVMVVVLEERIPVALWVDAPDSPAIVDGEGVIVTRSNLNAYVPILAVAGADANMQAQGLITLLKAEPVVAVRVKQANYISGRRWDLVLDNGTVIKLPQDDPGHALARLAKAQSEGKMLDYGYESIDLRHADRIIVENKPGDIRDLLSKGGDAV